jgi:hypothetical protein
MRLNDWLAFIEHELEAVLRTRPIAMIFTWLLFALIATVAACVWWVSPHIGIFLMYWPMAAICGLGIGLIGIVPILLLRRQLGRRAARLSWADQDLEH